MPSEGEAALEDLRAVPEAPYSVPQSDSESERVAPCAVLFVEVTDSPSAASVGRFLLGRGPIAYSRRSPPRPQPHGTAMLRLALPLLLAPFVVLPLQEAADPVTSEVVTTDSGELVLSHTVTIDAPRTAVWEAYTTTEGWKAWVAPNAEVDLRVGGQIRTHYEEGAALGDPGTNRLEIVSFVPNEVLVLRADVSDNWPDVLKADAEKLLNVIVFDDLGEAGTRIRAFGTGYTESPEMGELLSFFERANAMLYRGLAKHLEGR